MEKGQERVEEIGYRVEFARVVRKDLRKLSHNVRATLSEHIEALSENPRQGEPLHGVLRACFKFSQKLVDIWKGGKGSFPSFTSLPSIPSFPSAEM
jgi:mRNA-degrading endonuclease RelE of RelBE toxin-antitoxin system